VFTITTPPGDFDEFELAMIDFGLQDIFETEQGLLLHCEFASFGSMQKVLEERKVEVKSAGLQRYPNSTVKVSPQQEKEIEELIAELEEDDDVQHVYHNMHLND
jgi:transcriptional/translational regulatory protein YebC/TACO1